jgi:hypothetical protein
LDNARCLVGNEQTKEECPAQTVNSGNDTDDTAQKQRMGNFVRKESKSTNKSICSNRQMNEHEEKPSETVSFQDEQRKR